MFQGLYRQHFVGVGRPLLSSILQAVECFSSTSVPLEPTVVPGTLCLLVKLMLIFMTDCFSERMHRNEGRAYANLCESVAWVCLVWCVSHKLYRKLALVVVNKCWPVHDLTDCGLPSSLPRHGSCLFDHIKEEGPRAVYKRWSRSSRIGVVSPNPSSMFLFKFTFTSCRSWKLVYCEHICALNWMCDNIFLPLQRSFPLLCPFSFLLSACVIRSSPASYPVNAHSPPSA